MRVVQIIDSLYVGGAEKLQVTFARAAADQGFPSTVIVLRNYPGTPIPEQVRQAGAEIVEFDAKRLTDPIRFLKLVKYLRRGNVDVIHAHLTYAIVLGTLAARLAGIPIVASIHNTETDHWAFIENFFLRYLVHRVIAVGSAVARTYQPTLGRKAIEIVPNPVPSVPRLSDEEKNNLRASLMGNARRPFVLTVGRLEPQKGLFDLLDAAALVHQRIPDVFFAIAGIGTLKDQLANRIDALGLADNFCLLGVRGDIPALLSASDIFIISSHWEGLPVALLEAMSAGLPIVATAVGDIPNVLNDETGLLVPPQQPVELANAVCALLENLDHARQLGRAAQAYVEKHHSPSAWFDRLVQVYDQTFKNYHQGQSQ